MTFHEALKRKKKFISESSTFTKSLYHCLIIPVDDTESEKYIRDFKNNPSQFIDESCKRYTSGSDFKVIIIPTKDIMFNQVEKVTDDIKN